MTREELKELIRFAKENNLMKESIEKVLMLKEGVNHKRFY